MNHAGKFLLMLSLAAFLAAPGAMAQPPPSDPGTSKMTRDGSQSSGQTPPGWSQGKRKGWKGDTPPGFDEGKKKGWKGGSTPPGFDKGQKKGWKN